jgi:3-deoxy-D-manno-octulosonic-acid transferase
LFFFRIALFIAAPFNEKAGKWVKGRKNIFHQLQQSIQKEDKVIWVHCASLGEFEQGRPVIEKLRSSYPLFKILLTFFSPSGYEAQKNYSGADWVFYLPLDGATNARRFLEITHPSLVIFVKYEFWYYYLKKIKYREIPIILISALFRKDMSFFKWYGGLSRKMLSRFDHLFVQNKNSLVLLTAIGLGNISSISGDTRFDRVIDIAANAKPDFVIEQFKKNSLLVVAGSTWQEDEAVIQKVYTSMPQNLKWIIAPHEISEKHIQSLLRQFPGAIRYSHISTASPVNSNANVLIIDSIGLLSQLYLHAHISYVGGGLRTMGVHNVLEAAVYYKPVIFGYHYEKYSEAIDLVKAGGGLPFSDEKKNGQMLSELITGLLLNTDEYNFCCRAAGDYVRSQQGATERIMEYIHEKRLLTN